MAAWRDTAAHGDVCCAAHQVRITTVSGLLHRILAHPLTKGMDVDDPRTTQLRRQIIREKAFLSRIYCEWYTRLAANMQPDECFLELGSAAGFFRQFAPNLITSELFAVPGVDRIVDARHLPFANDELDGIVMTDVLHHITDVERFFHEASRCIKPGGQVLMIEPWNTPWARWVYQRLHSEPFQPRAGWTIPDTGPLSGANGALPWILFERDRARFQEAFPEWHIASIELLMPISYLLSGGVSLRALVPGWAYRPIRWLESLLVQKKWAMFAFIRLRKFGPAATATPNGADPSTSVASSALTPARPIT
jgi:SAM-dependent methyltransferase